MTQRRRRRRGGRGGARARRRGPPAPRRRPARRRRPRRPAARARPASASTTWAESEPASAAISSSPLRRQVSRAGTTRATASGTPSANAAQGRMSPTATVPMTAAPDGDRHRQQRAEVEVLQRVDVVDGAGEQVAAAPPGQRGGHPRGRGSRRARAASGSARAARRRGRRGVRRSAAARAGRPAPRPRPGCRRWRRGPGAARPGRRRSPSRPAGRWWRPPRPGPSSPAPREPPVGRAGLGQDAAERARGAGSRRDRQREPRRRRQRDDGVEVGEEDGLVRGHHDGAARRARARSPGPGAPRSAGRATAVGSSSSRTGAGRSRARASATRWRSPGAEGEAVVADGGVAARRAGWPGGRPARRRRARARRSSSVASGAPRRRFSARVALKRWGRWGSQEKWPRHAAASRRCWTRPPTAIVPPLGSTKRKQRGQHRRLARPRRPGQRHAASRAAACSENDDQGGPVPVLVVDAEPVDASGPARCRRRRRPSAPPARRLRRGGGRRPSTSSTRAAAACPSVLAWNSAPARRSGMKISGATSRTAMAVCRSSSPPEQPQPEHHGDEVRRRTRRSCPWRGRRGRRRAACAWWPRARLRSPPRPRGGPAPRGRRRAASGVPRRAGGSGRPASRAGATGAPSACVASRPK